VHVFLASRGIRLPEGRLDDPPDAETAHGLVNHKREVLARGLRQRRTIALPHARRYLEAAGHAGLARAVVSASASTTLMLTQASLSSLVELLIDAEMIRLEQLRSRPAPDVLLAACRHLGVAPENVVSFTHSPAGVAAAHAAAVNVIGIGGQRRAEVLGGFGATTVVPSLGVLLDRHLRALGAP
jgi:HAD superfamily hydrolase (TIGR01509 family)